MEDNFNKSRSLEPEDAPSIGRLLMVSCSIADKEPQAISAAYAWRTLRTFTFAYT